MRMAVSGRHAELPRFEVEEAPTVDVPDLAAPSAGKDERRWVGRLHDVGLVERKPALGIDRRSPLRPGNPGGAAHGSDDPTREVMYLSTDTDDPQPVLLPVERMTLAPHADLLTVGGMILITVAGLLVAVASSKKVPIEETATA
jgi:hypothetical protein